MEISQALQQALPNANGISLTEICSYYGDVEWFEVEISIEEGTRVRGHFGYGKTFGEALLDALTGDGQRRDDLIPKGGFGFNGYRLTRGEAYVSLD